MHETRKSIKVSSKKSILQQKTLEPFPNNEI